MQTTRRLAVLTVLATVLIAAGALFLIAPVWQPQRPAFRRGALALSPGGGVDLLVWLRSAALRMEFFCLNKICS